MRPLGGAPPPELMCSSSCAILSSACASFASVSCFSVIAASNPAVTPPTLPLLLPPSSIWEGIVSRIYGRQKSVRPFPAPQVVLSKALHQYWTSGWPWEKQVLIRIVEMLSSPEVRITSRLVQDNLWHTLFNKLVVGRANVGVIPRGQNQVTRWMSRAGTWCRQGAAGQRGSKAQQECPSPGSLPAQSTRLHHPTPVGCCQTWHSTSSKSI